MKTLSKKDKRVVAVFGATGHTGRFVVAELSQRGMTPVAVARDAEALTNGSVLNGT
jgi:putative NADH-flavin reductase